MNTTVEIKERDSHGIVEIVKPNGTTFRITFSDDNDTITVQTVEGKISIQPSVSNEIRITALK